MLDKEKCFESVVYAPKYNKINLVIPQKTREIIFDTAWNMFHRYSYDEAVGCLDSELYDQANEYNLQCTYDKLINMYLKLHPEKNIYKQKGIEKMEKTVKFIATYIDTMSDGGDFTPHVMGVYDSEDEAREEIFEDMDEFWNTLDEDEQDELKFDHDRMRITDGDGLCQFICWNVEKIEI